MYQGKGGGVSCFGRNIINLKKRRGSSTITPHQGKKKKPEVSHRRGKERDLKGGRREKASSIKSPKDGSGRKKNWAGKKKLPPTS